MEGLAVVVVIGLIGFALFRTVWDGLRKNCPRCGQRIKQAASVCPFCDYRFRMIPRVDE